ncbi:FAD binding domain-containing protein [Propylenella binzhouense]|uniref:Carbon monoxide dehydrogenase n=1 Tax=Propylenella binzhouense TaxID=2555902 RepID=A0A964T8B1_9HYPH|nr:FAD binding domain-containing protein [Propylenella binzhouense]MYZ49197.1 carbon monoxide dehydrogenase [Propylenella binzhouense]
MKPAPIAYVRPDTVERAVGLLSESGGEAKVLAGGQSLVPMLNLRIAAFERLVDVTGLPGLRSASDEGSEVRLGACVTHERIQTGDVPDPSNGLMPSTASRIAYQAVRNRGTIGGSLALADPAADWLATMAALGAAIEWVGPDGPGSCPAEAFVEAAYTTRLGLYDVLTGIRIPRLHPDARWGTYKLCRKTGEFAHAMAIAIRQPGGCRAFLGATEGAPIRLPAVEDMLAGLRGWDASDAARLGEAMAADVAAAGRSLSDVHAWQSRTCLARAVAMSFGAAPPRLGRAA